MGAFLGAATCGAPGTAGGAWAPQTAGGMDGGAVGGEAGGAAGGGGMVLRPTSEPFMFAVGVGGSDGGGGGGLRPLRPGVGS